MVSMGPQITPTISVSSFDASSTTPKWRPSSLAWCATINSARARRTTSVRSVSASFAMDSSASLTSAESRRFSWTSFRPDTCTTYSLSVRSGRTIHLHRVIPEYRLLPRLGHLDRQRGARIIKIPVRIIRCEQDPVPTDPVKRLGQLAPGLRFLDRLGREPDIRLDILGRCALRMRDLLFQLLPLAVQPPGQGCGPAQAPFDEHDLQIRHTLEHAFQDHADQH